MPYDRWGRTPEQARRDRAFDMLLMAALALLVSACLVWGLAWCAG